MQRCTSCTYFYGVFITLHINVIRDQCDKHVVLFSLTLQNIMSFQGYRHNPVCKIFLANAPPQYKNDTCLTFGILFKVQTFQCLQSLAYHFLPIRYWETTCEKYISSDLIFPQIFFPPIYFFSNPDHTFRNCNHQRPGSTKCISNCICWFFNPFNLG